MEAVCQQFGGGQSSAGNGQGNASSEQNPENSSSSAGNSFCGNGKLESFEECDPSVDPFNEQYASMQTRLKQFCIGQKNHQGIGACTSTCTIENGTTCSNVCGNGRLDEGPTLRESELCDPTAPITGTHYENRRALCALSVPPKPGIATCSDECDIDFELENPASCQNLCGNGEKDPEEECDDGSPIPLLWWLHRNSNTEPDACRLDCRNHRCGDGVKDSDEQCDDGNNNNLDECSNSCTVPTFCGDGTLTPGEACDYSVCDLHPASDSCEQQRATLAQACTNIGQIGNASCTYECNISTSTCGRCGDGRTEPPEECDDGNSEDTDDCTNACKGPICGDGIVWKNHEKCDDGNTNNFDACMNDCTLQVVGAICRYQDSKDGLPNIEAFCRGKTQVQCEKYSGYDCEWHGDSCTNRFIDDCTVFIERERNTYKIDPSRTFLLKENDPLPALTDITALRYARFGHGDENSIEEATREILMCLQKCDTLGLSCLWDGCIVFKNLDDVKNKVDDIKRSLKPTQSVVLTADQVVHNFTNKSRALINIMIKWVDESVVATWNYGSCHSATDFCFIHPENPPWSYCKNSSGDVIPQQCCAERKPPPGAETVGKWREGQTCDYKDNQGSCPYEVYSAGTANEATIAALQQVDACLKTAEKACKGTFNADQASISPDKGNRATWFALGNVNWDCNELQ